MSAGNRRDELLGLLDRLHAGANHLRTEVTVLQETIRFDHESPSARAAAGRIESELGQLADGLRSFREAFEAGGKRSA